MITQLGSSWSDARLEDGQDRSQRVASRSRALFKLSGCGHKRLHGLVASSGAAAGRHLDAVASWDATQPFSMDARGRGDKNTII
jgi:hypothetical protein